MLHRRTGCNVVSSLTLGRHRGPWKRHDPTRQATSEGRPATIRRGNLAGVMWRARMPRELSHGVGPAHDNAFGMASERRKCVGRTATRFPNVPVSDRRETVAAWKGSPVMRWPSRDCRIRKHPAPNVNASLNFTIHWSRESLEIPIRMTDRNTTASMSLPTFRICPLICCNIYFDNTKQKHLHFDHESILHWYEQARTL